MQSQLEKPIIPTEEVPFTFRWELSQHISVNIQTKYRKHEGRKPESKKMEPNDRCRPVLSDCRVLILLVKVYLP